STTLKRAQKHRPSAPLKSWPKRCKCRSTNSSTSFRKMNRTDSIISSLKGGDAPSAPNPKGSEADPFFWSFVFPHGIWQEHLFVPLQSEEVPFFVDGPQWALETEKRGG